VLRRLLIVAAVLVAAWVVVCLVLFAFPPAETGAPARADAIVVLAGAHERLPPALELVRQGVAPRLLISSVSRSRPWPLAQRLCAAGRYAGADVVCFDAAPYSTQGEARAVGRMARSRGWKSLVVVSSRFHLTRAKLLFRRCYPGSLSLVGVPTKWWRIPGEWVSETGKLFVQLTYQRSC
jgi:uncharacterized SAM-binding protein YcdF (DUF218 family)